jgi:hypothetical protein
VIFLGSGSHLRANQSQNQRGITAGYNGLFTLVGSILASVIAGVIVNKNDALPLYKNEIVQIFLLIALVQIVFVVQIRGVR